MQMISCSLHGLILATLYLTVQGRCPGSCDPECGPVDVFFAVDTSGSIAKPSCGECKGFLKGITDGLPLGNDVKTSGLSFNRTTALLWSFNDPASTDKEAVKSIWDNLPPSRGETYTHRALLNTRLFMANSSRPDACKVIVMVTDGGSDKKPPTRKQADKLREAGIRMCLVAVGAQNTNREVENNYILTGQDSGGDPQGALISAPQFGLLPSKVDDVLDCICTCRGENEPTTEIPPAPTPTPPGPPPAETTPAPSPCFCEILDDPIAATCDGTILPVSSSVLDPVTQTQDLLVASDGSVGVILRIGLTDGKLLPQLVRLLIGPFEFQVYDDGTVLPNNVMPGLVQPVDNNYTMNDFTGVFINFSSGLQIRFGRSQGAFIKLLLTIPDEVLGQTSGICTSNMVDLYVEPAEPPAISM